MLNEIINTIISLKWPVLIYCLIVVLLCGIYWLLTNKFEFNKSKTYIFGLMYNLTKTKAIIFALLLGRWCFVLTSALFCKSVNLGHLIVLLLFSIIIFILQKDIKVLIENVLVNVAIYAMLFFESSLLNYYNTVEALLVVKLMVIMIGLFAVLYSALQLVNNYESLLKK